MDLSFFGHSVDLMCATFAALLTYKWYSCTLSCTEQHVSCDGCDDSLSQMPDATDFLRVNNVHNMPPGEKCS